MGGARVVLPALLALRASMATTAPSAAWAPGRRAASAVVLVAALVASASASVAPTVTSLASGVGPGVAGSPTFRTLHLSYVGNWQFSTTSAVNGVPSLSNNNFYVLRALPVGWW